jgi:hypothetical protein
MTDFIRQASGTMGGTGTMGTTRRWEDYRDTYRRDWEGQYGQNRPWSQHELAYRYGWESAQQDRWRDKEWHYAESDLQSGWHDWNSQHMHGSDLRNEHKDHSVGDHQSLGGKVEHVWDNFKDTVKEGWDRARMGFDR